MPTLLIRVLAQGADSPVQWFVVDEPRQIRSSGHGELSSLQQLLTGESGWVRDPVNVVVFLPGEYFLNLNCSVPGRSAGHIRKALPFVVEEYLASDIDSMHIAYGPIRRGEKVPCLAVAKKQMDDWRQSFDALGLTPGIMLPDTLLMPKKHDCIVVLLDGDRGILASENHLLALETELLPMALCSLLQDLSVDAAEQSVPDSDEPAPRIGIELVNGDLNPIQKSELESLTDVQVEWHNTVLQGSAGEWLLDCWFDNAPTWNLLQGSYSAPKSENSRWNRWRGAGVLALGWLMLIFATQLAKGFWANYQAATLTRESIAMYRQYFPQDKKVTGSTVKRLMQAHLGQASSQGQGFLGLLKKLAPALTDHQTSLNSLGYNDVREVLSAEVTVPGFENLDTLEQDLKRAGLTVEISSAEQQQHQVTARLRLKAAT